MSRRPPNISRSCSTASSRNDFLTGRLSPSAKKFESLAFRKRSLHGPSGKRSQCREVWLTPTRPPSKSKGEVQHIVARHKNLVNLTLVSQRRHSTSADWDPAPGLRKLDATITAVYRDAPTELEGVDVAGHPVSNVAFVGSLPPTRLQFVIPMAEMNFEATRLTQQSRPRIAVAATEESGCCVQRSTAKVAVPPPGFLRAWRLVVGAARLFQLDGGLHRNVGVVRDFTQRPRLARLGHLEKSATGRRVTEASVSLLDGREGRFRERGERARDRKSRNAKNWHIHLFPGRRVSRFFHVATTAN
ncbi:hypothetical protein C8F04DRAFT_1192231 [Mycena alexandri]|uniref:Uncharacterized protein n=1 Tax=Mycena alexandri TaxID=1745969 RepID=A0AAD6SFK4_9AGAR|nr:hypothetical protein C8F04DRAFT_1192231 [Mycena alexandri]